ASFVGRVSGTADHVRAEDKRDNAALHVLVDARQPVKRIRQPGFFGDLAYGAILDRLIEFEDASRCFPMAVVSTLRNEHSSTFIDHDRGHTHGMPCTGAHISTCLGLVWSLATHVYVCEADDDGAYRPSERPGRLPPDR